MARHTGDRASTGTDTDGRPVNKTVEVAQDLVAAFERIKSVKGVYQQEITRVEAPDIYLYGTVGAISLPLVNKQAKEMVDTALVGSYNVRKPGCRQTWAAKMLVILPSTHDGDIKLEFKPPEKGNRLGLLYDLHVRRPLKYSQQRATHHSAVQAVQDAVEKYTVLVRNECIQETAFFLPLSTKIPKHASQRPDPSSIGKNMLLPSDLAKVECFSEKGMDEVRGFETHIALAEVTARDKMTIYRAWGTKMVEHFDTEYLLQKVVDTQGVDNLGQTLRRLGGTKLDAEIVPVVDAFNSGLTRTVTHQGDTEKHVFLKTTLCLLIHFEQMD